MPTPSRAALAAVFALLPLAVACGDKDGGDSGTAGGEYDAILSLSGDATAGADVFAGKCAACHGADGEGGTGPAMSGIVANHTDEQLLDVMFNGSGSMPAVSIEDQDAADLLAYLNDTF